MAIKLFAAVATLAALTSKLTAVGLNVDDILKGDENFLKSALEGAAAPQITALESKVADLEKRFSATEAKASAAETRLGIFTSALAAAKIEVKADATAEQISAAIKASTSIKAREFLAKHGLEEMPEASVESDPSKPKGVQAKLTGLSRTASVYREKYQLS